MKALLARSLRALADWLHPMSQRYGGSFNFRTGINGAVIERVWVDGQPFVPEPKPLPVFEVDIDAVHRTRRSKNGRRQKRDAHGRYRA